MKPVRRTRIRVLNTSSARYRRSIRRTERAISDSAARRQEQDRKLSDPSNDPTSVKAQT